MNDVDYRQALEAAFTLMESAEEDEALAREFKAKGYDPAKIMQCGFEWGGVECRTCETMPECDLWLREYQDQTIRLFQSAWSGYQKALTILRSIEAERDEPIVWRMLARTLLAVDDHPNNMNKAPEERYREAQYWYLRLFYAAGDGQAFESAKRCEALRREKMRLTVK